MTSFSPEGCAQPATRWITPLSEKPAADWSACFGRCLKIQFTRPYNRLSGNLVRSGLSPDKRIWIDRIPRSSLHNPREQGLLRRNGKPYRRADSAELQVLGDAGQQRQPEGARKHGPARAVKPSQELHIDYQQGDDLGGYVVYLIHENGRWFYDYPCATNAAIKEYRDNAAANEASLAHYKALASEIKQPLRSELLGLLRAHETATATDRYHQATGQDYKTSMYVINALKTEGR